MATKKQNSTESETPQNAYFMSLQLENVRCFGQRQIIRFSDDKGRPKQWSIILGDNGTGKTTLLKTLTSVCPEFGQTGNVNIFFRPQYVSIVEKLDENWEFTRSKDKDFLIKTWFLNKAGLRWRLGENLSLFGIELQNAGSISWNLIAGSNSSSVACFAYGASRKSGSTSISEHQVNSPIHTLFDETFLLLNPEEWFIRADYFASKGQSESQRVRNHQLKIVTEMLKGALPDIEDIKIDEKKVPHKRIPQPIVVFKTPYGWVEAKDLSLGYRTSMAWMVDFASGMFDLYPESKNPLAEPAVVLIDEIDLHLHPKWQRDLLDWLSKLCPNTQFIVTTHSPLIVQAGLEHDANIFVCRRNEKKDFVEIEQINEHLKTLRVDQILSGDYFEVPPRGAKTEKLLDEKETILSKPKLTKSDEKRLAELDEKIGFLPVSENPEDNEVMQILKEAADWVKTNGKR